ncbi:cation transporting ATPase C-terminal domain-containing protein [Actinoplanes sp. NPDC026623]|uniref:cation transporting ATPase C-terminal domain-containing protein n=1 Tax=Actinoplanes sp. NPDC026623 TaxID=3155610 RepID=UPI0033F74439
MLGSVLIGGLCVAGVVLAAGVTARHYDRPWQSVMFIVLGLAQLGVALAVRAKAAPGTARNTALLGAVALSAILQVAGVLLAPLQLLLGTQPLTAAELLACTVVAAMPGLGLAIVQHRAEKFGTFGPPLSDLPRCPEGIDTPDD